MYALQKLATKMAPRLIAHPELIPFALVIGGIVVISEILD